ncbi:hypothetical protein QCA50_019123 [Cerrena zonata]|uniref:XPG-I domain-containing protein n=1 Tax=Cerrena zonata TaxID=2478898 RepID=A0AAW0FA05_9APHY
MNCDPLIFKKQLWHYPDESVWFKEWVKQQASYIPVNKPPLTLGINASEWIMDLEGPISLLNIAHKRNQTLNEVTDEIFMHLGQYVSLPLQLIFVEDSTGVSNLSRRTQEVKEVIKTLAKAFEFYWHEAPIYASAELAHINKLGFIHAIITNDFSTFLYGANTVIERPVFIPTPSIILGLESIG